MQHETSYAKVPEGIREPVASHETLGDIWPLLTLNDGSQQVGWANQEPPSIYGGECQFTPITAVVLNCLESGPCLMSA